MNKVLFYILFLISTCTCVSPNRVNDKLDVYEQCKECDEYIHYKLIPQMKTCVLGLGEKLDSLEDCKFNRAEMKKYASCLLGMKRDSLVKLIGSQYWYSVKGRAQASSVFDLKYNDNNQRLIEIDLLNDESSINATVGCLECDNTYKKIKRGEQFNEINYQQFVGRNKGCFYGKTPPYLVSKLGLEEKIEEDNYHFSYNKEVLLGRDRHELNFLFYPGQRMVDISPADSVLNRKNYWVY